MLKDYQELLERGFAVLNKVYFNNELPPIVISIMSSPKTNGHFTIGKVWRVENERMNEINVSAQHLDRPVENVMSTMCHEMVHYYCQIHGLHEVSQNGRYHNKIFKREAEKRGLVIGYAKYIGYSVTEPSEEFKNIIKSYGLEKPIELNRDGEIPVPIGVKGGNGDGDGNTTAKKKSSTRKYMCPACGASFRATRDINVLHEDCNNVKFVKVEL